MLAQAHRSRRTRSGFTILELLVALAIICVLVSLLLPALRGARQRAAEGTCAARLRQWGLAFSCYAAENRAYWPHCDGLDRGPRDLGDPFISPEDVADWHGWVDVVPPLLGLASWRSHPRGERPRADSFYQCPQGEPLPGRGVYSYYPQRDGYFSYAMNSCLELDANAWPPPGGEGYPMPSFLDTDRLVRPAAVVLLFDQLLDPAKGFDANSLLRAAGKYCGSYPKAFAARHQRGRSRLGGNILYGDGHVEWLGSVWKPWWPRDLEVPPRSDGNWYPYPVAAGN